MSRKREPMAEIVDEDYRIVRHTHDVREAEIRMRALLGCHTEIGCGESEGCYTTGCTGVVKLGTPHQVWVRVVPALPNSWAAREGLRYTFNPAEPGSRGAFRAVEFR